jgi:hypothetical protein
MTSQVIGLRPTVGRGLLNTVRETTMNETTKIPQKVTDFVKSIDMQMTNTIERGRHRATMLRERANEIDKDCDQLEEAKKQLPGYIGNWVSFERKVHEDIISLSLVEPRPVIAEAARADEEMLSKSVNGERTVHEYAPGKFISTDDDVDIDSEIDPEKGNKLAAEINRLLGR